MTTRARKGRIIVTSAMVGGILLDIAHRQNSSVLAFDEVNNKYIHMDIATLETDPVFQGWLATNPLDQFARVDHDHEIGDMVTLFNNVIS